jgi:adenylate cyclase class 2
MTDEQRSQTGWIGVQESVVILTRALRESASLSFVLEREVKFRIASWEEGERRLAERGAEIRVPRYFETNALFDFPGRMLEKRGEALRVRQARGRAWLTYKGPVHGSGRIKQRKEYETALGDASVVVEVFRVLGLSECFLYEKYRAVYSLGDLDITLDEAPMGFYLELEGLPDRIEAVADILGLRMEEAISLTYPRLYQLYRDEIPQAPEFMVFPKDEGPR